MTNLTQLLAARREAMGLSEWDLAVKYCQIRNESNVDRYGSAALRAQQNLEGCKWATIRDLFLATGLDLTTIIAAASAASQPPKA